MQTVIYSVGKIKFLLNKNLKNYRRHITIFMEQISIPDSLPYIYVRKVNPVFCPCCRQIQPNRTDCLCHLILNCTCFDYKAKDGISKDVQKRNFHDWLCDFFKFYSSCSKDCDQSTSTKIVCLLADDEIENKQKLEITFASCPICNEFFFEDKMFEHILQTCILVESAEDVKYFIYDFFSSNEGQNFNAYLTCFLCNFTTMYPFKFTNHVVAEHWVKCNCDVKLHSVKEIKDHLNADRSSRNRKAICEITCPICREKKFKKESVIYLEDHLLICTPPEHTEKIFDTNIYKFCFLCEPARKILCIEFPAHFYSHIV